MDHKLAYCLNKRVVVIQACRSQFWVTIDLYYNRSRKKKNAMTMLIQRIHDQRRYCQLQWSA